MCSPVTCQICGKTTWRGCGKHIDQVRVQVPPDQWRPGHEEEAQNRGSFFGIFR